MLRSIPMRYPKRRNAPTAPLLSCLLGGIMLMAGYSHRAAAQVTGGQYAFEFLRMANSAHVSALGGMSVANPEQDISLALQNPAMMRPGLHNQLQLTYNAYYADINIANLQYGYHAPKLNTSFFFGLQYLNYGKMDHLDYNGNSYGTFYAVDNAFTFGASRTYLEHWRYGASVKLATSQLGENKAMAALMDIGINYYDTASMFDFGVVAKNMGVMVRKYTAANPSEPVPFDLQLGVSKRFKHIPLRVFSTIHHLYEWDIRYSNPQDLIGTNSIGLADTASDGGKHTVDKIARHFIFGAEVTFGSRVVVTGSYNFLHRKELALSTQTGAAGFAFGIGIKLNKFNINYGRNYYHIAGPYNEISLTMCFNKLFGLGKTGEKIGWNSTYPDWE